MLWLKPDISVNQGQLELLHALLEVLTLTHIWFWVNACNVIQGSLLNECT